MQESVQESVEVNMHEYTPPFVITNRIISLLTSIALKIGQLTVTSNLEAKPHLRRNNTIKSIHSSLKIEANSLSLNQVRDIINGKVVLGKQKEIQEVKNAIEAYDLIDTIDPYKISALKKTQGVMTKYLVKESGVFRSGGVGVFDEDNNCIFMPPPANMVPTLMSKLFNWMKRAQYDIHPLILSCVFHYEFVFIHPFADGNGELLDFGIQQSFRSGNLFLSTFRLNLR